MKFALGLPFTTSPPNASFVSVGAIARLATEAEKAGFDAVFLTEHPAPSDEWRSSGGHDALDPFVGLTVAATVTTRLRLLTNLTVVPYRNPFLLAKTVATLDALSGGRLILGVGTGYLKSEYAALGVDFDERNDLFDESLEVMRLAWTGEPVTHRGRYFEANETVCQPTPQQSPHPPIWVGGNSRLARRRAVRWGGGWMPMYNPKSLGSRRHSDHLDDIDDLARMLGYIERQRRETASDRLLDVLFAPLTGGNPGTTKWNPERYREALAQLENLGVTWCMARLVQKELEAAVDAIAQYADDIINHPGSWDHG